VIVQQGKTQDVITLPLTSMKILAVEYLKTQAHVEMVGVAGEIAGN